MNALDYIIKEDNIEQVDEAYIRRCIESYGLDANEILRKHKWREG